QPVYHTYYDAVTYTITATLTDASGNVQTTSTAVSVIPAAFPSIIITPQGLNSCTGAGQCFVTFQIQVTPPAGIGIVSAFANFGTQATPQTQGFGAISGTLPPVTVTYPAHAGVQIVTVTVTDTLGRTTQGYTSVNIP